MPEEAKQQTKAGAEAFVRYYIEAVNHAQATGDVEPLEEVSPADCASCQNLIASISDFYDGGGSIEGGAWRIDKALVLEQAGDRVEVDAFISYGPQAVQDSPAARPKTLRGGRTPLSFFLKRDAGGWMLERWTRGS